MSECLLRVLSDGVSWVQDLGRTSTKDGLAAHGALDQYSAKMANALVANAESVPLIESMGTEIEVQLSREALVSVCGAAGAVLLDEVPAAAWQPIVAPGGSRVRVVPAAAGLRTYLAVRGEWHVHTWAGSVSPDRPLGLGTFLTHGSEITISGAGKSLSNPTLGVGLFRPSAVPRAIVAGVQSIDLMSGPDLAEFEGLEQALAHEKFTIDPRSDHVGIRLNGALDVSGSVDEVLSHGVPIGAVELTPDRQLIVLLRGRSITAGYPIVGFVSTTSLDTLGQLRPGDQLRFQRKSRELCIVTQRQVTREICRVNQMMSSALASISEIRQQAS